MGKEIIDFLTKLYIAMKNDTKIVKKYYDSGEFKNKVKSVIPYENGLVQGKMITYYPNGNIEMETEFHKGI